MASIIEILDSVNDAPIEPQKFYGNDKTASSKNGDESDFYETESEAEYSSDEDFNRKKRKQPISNRTPSKRYPKRQRLENVPNREESSAENSDNEISSNENEETENPGGRGQNGSSVGEDAWNPTSEVLQKHNLKKAGDFARGNKNPRWVFLALTVVAKDLIVRKDSDNIYNVKTFHSSEVAERLNTCSCFSGYDVENMKFLVLNLRNKYQKATANEDFSKWVPWVREAKRMMENK